MSLSSGQRHILIATRTAFNNGRIAYPDFEIVSGTPDSQPATFRYATLPNGTTVRIPASLDKRETRILGKTVTLSNTETASLAVTDKAN